MRKQGTARLCPTPPDLATQAVDKEGDTDEESEVGWKRELIGEGDEDNDILGVGWESKEQKQVGASRSCGGLRAQLKTSCQQACAVRVKLSATLAGLKQALDFVEPAESESRNRG